MKSNSKGQMNKQQSRRLASRKRNPRPTTLMRSLPNHYPRAPGDGMSTKFTSTYLVEIPTGSGYRTELIVLGRGVSSATYTFLNDLSTVFNANATCYTRWMISDLAVEIRATGVGGSSNTFIAASYIPSNSTLDSPPVSLPALSQSNHYAQSALGTVGRFSVNCTDYFNDWRQLIDGADDSDSQVGLVQLYTSASVTSGTVTGGVVNITGTLHFCGLRV